MEAAFVDIGTPKNAVLYRGDVQYDAEDVEEKGQQPRIEQMLQGRARSIICQVTKNPIGAKGARLTQEVSLAGPVRRADPEQHAPTASPSACPTTSASACGASSTRCKPAEHGADRAHRGRGRHRRGARARRAAAARPVGADRRRWPSKAEGAGAALPGARHGRAGDPRGVQQGVPRRRHRRPRAATRRCSDYVDGDHARAGRPGRVLRRRAEERCRSSSGSTSTSSCTRRSTARCGCRRAARSSSSTPRRSR